MTSIIKVQAKQIILNNIKKKFKQIQYIILVVLLTSNPAFAASGIYAQGPRKVDGYDASGSMCHTSAMKFDPFTSKDITWEVDNPVCISYIATTVGALKAIRLLIANFCIQPHIIAEEAASAASGVPLPPSMILSNAKAASQCATTRDVLCCGGMISLGIQLAAAITSLATIYGAAQISHDTARICGTDYNTWQKDTSWNGNSEKWIFGNWNGSYQKNLMTTYQSGITSSSSNPITIQKFREYLYGGREYSDNGSGACKNPIWPQEDLIKRLGYSDENQRYYYRGPKLAPNYACERFLLNNTTDKNEKQSGMDAFKCCNKRSQETMCIEVQDQNINSSAPYIRQFCKLGERCHVGPIWYDIYKSKIAPNYLCAKTYSVCPYNHLLGGGTEIEEYDDQGVLKNYCQYMKHCIKIPDPVYIRTSNLDGAYIDGSCYDMKGDSQNDYSYNFEILPIQSKHFTAPVAQCFKETMSNVFLHKAGTTKCLNIDETPDQKGECQSGYSYKKGGPAPGTSFFSNLQDQIRTLIKMVISVSITMLGVNVLLAGKQIERKELSMYIIKLGIIAYFALGNAWQSTFFEGVFNAGGFISDIVMRPDEDKPKEQLDGCQFPRFNYSDIEDTDPTHFAYPPGKNYLRIWDMFDCKIAMALGFGPGLNVPNLVLMILGGLFTGGAGVIFFVASFLFAFYLIALAIRALHIFLLSCVSIVLLIYISPITITMALFKKTDSIYKKWQGQLIGMILQPVILFAYLGILITIFNKTMIGDIKFSTQDGRIGPKQIICSGPAAEESIYCIFKVAEIRTFTGFEPLGIGIPMLYGINQNKISTIIKAAILMFVFSKILDQIPSVSAELVGGKKLTSSTPGVSSMAKEAFENISAIQKRGTRGLAKHGPGIARGVKNKIKNKIGELAIKRKEIKRPGATNKNNNNDQAGKT